MEKLSSEEALKKEAENERNKLVKELGIKLEVAVKNTR
jgi:hypothetical protein